jgi:hypothetical protein
MENEYRRTDSLAYATGSFQENLDEVSNKWSNNTKTIVDIGPKVIHDIRKVVKEKVDVAKQKKTILSNLSALGSLFNELEGINAEMFDLMTEMEGLDFPLKTPKQILSFCKKEEEAAELLQTITKNLSKTITFIENGDTEEELIENSLSSFETAFIDFQEKTLIRDELTSALKVELEKEHKKARKYLGIV